MNNIKISENFNLKEFECPCCHRVMLDSKLLNLLQKLRDTIQEPIIITSGYRCKDENERVGGVKNSYHLFGMAADITISTRDLTTVRKICRKIGFMGIGFYYSRSFIHLDVRHGTRAVMWSE